MILSRLKRTEKWSENYTCKECEDKVNCKGHFTKPQEAEFFYKKSCAITCIECKKHLFLRKKKKHLMLNMWRMPQTFCAVTCKECGKQFLALRKVMNRNLQWLRVYFFSEKEIYQTSSAIPCA